MVSLIDILKSAGFTEVYNSNQNPQELQYMTYTYTSYFNTSVFSAVNIFYPLSEPGIMAIDVIFTSLVAQYSISPCDSYIFYNIGVTISGELTACVDSDCRGQSYTYSSASVNTGGCQSSLVISGYVGGGQKLPLFNSYVLYFRPQQYPYIGGYFSFDFAGLGSPGALYSVVIEIQPTYIDWWRYNPLFSTLNTLFSVMYAIVFLHAFEMIIHTFREHKRRMQ